MSRASKASRMRGTREVPVSMALEDRTRSAPTLSGALPAGRFLSVEECRVLIGRLVGYATGGGRTTVALESRWRGNLRWARNRIISSGDVRDNNIELTRDVRGAKGESKTNTLDERRLYFTLRRAERMAAMRKQSPTALAPAPPFIEPYPEPKLWFDSTYQQEATQRAALMRTLVEPAKAAGMLAAGYLEVGAAGRVTMDGERIWYYPYTTAQYSVTVRSPDGSGSGWAGMDHNDWTKIDTPHLTQVALEKCLRSRNPVRLEPGRYTAILEPQAVGDLVMAMFSRTGLSREGAEFGDPLAIRSDPYGVQPTAFARLNEQGRPNGYSRLGEKVIDERLSVRTDCLDPAAGFPPFERWQVFHPVTWIQDGVLKELAYYRAYAVKRLGLNSGGLVQWGPGKDDGRWWQPQKGNKGQEGKPPDTGVFHMSVRGATVSIEEMVANTKRGLLVTRFWGVTQVQGGSAAQLLTGYTRDGLWLVENGKISKPVKNFRFTDSPVYALNNVEQIGTPQRIYNPGYPIVVPALTVRDFSFTALADAV